MVGGGGGGGRDRIKEEHVNFREMVFHWKGKLQDIFKEFIFGPHCEISPQYAYDINAWLCINITVTFTVLTPIVHFVHYYYCNMFSYTGLAKYQKITPQYCF